MGKIQRSLLKNWNPLGSSLWYILLRAQKTRKPIKTRLGRFLLERRKALVVRLRTLCYSLAVLFAFSPGPEIMTEASEIKRDRLINWAEENFVLFILSGLV